MKFVVYSITNTVTKEQYIGSTQDFKNRQRIHLMRANGGPKGNTKLYQNMRMFGIRNFQFNIMSTHRTADAMLKRERDLIRNSQPELNTNGKKHG